LDLSGLERFDAFGLCLLALLGWKAKEEGGFPRFFLPEEREVAEELSRTGLFRLLSGAFWADKALPEANGNGRFLLVRVEREEGIGSLVEAFAGMLESRFPFGERTNRILVGAVLELLQNIPHHAAAGREDLAPVGFAALEEAEDHLHLAVVDGGVGLRGSLSLNPRYRGVSTAEALELILVEGASRFEEPGRGWVPQAHPRGGPEEFREVLRPLPRWGLLPGGRGMEGGKLFPLPRGPDLHPSSEKAFPRWRTW
jgi:anti-sigma regulatory factor (Ser/Thr protein kinase)